MDGMTREECYHWSIQKTGVGIALYQDKMKLLGIFDSDAEAYAFACGYTMANRDWTQELEEK